MSDAINPDHYKRLPAEAIEIIESAINNAPSNQAALLHGQVLKYILRCWHKNGIEDLRKAKWYLDRLIEHCDESLIDLNKGLVKAWTCENGKAKQVYPEQLKPTLNSDNIPEGYRKLKNSSIEPRQRGDLRWSVAEKRYIEIGFDEIGYANRDNWAACRRITEEVTGEGTGEVKPPDGWRWLEVGEVIRKGDRCFTNHSGSIDCLTSVGEKFNHESHYPTIRRNKFEVGEKVVENIKQRICIVKEKIWRFESPFSYRVEMLDTKSERYFFPHHLAPYIEETK